MDKVKIVIEFDSQTGKVGVLAPLENKVLCLGMLMMASKLVQDHDPAKQQTAPSLLLPRPINGVR